MNPRLRADRPRSRVGLLSGLGRFAPNRVFFSVLLGALSGCLYALAIPIILSSLREPDDGLTYAGAIVTRVAGIEVSHVRLAAFFMLLCVLILISRALAVTIMARVSLDLATRLRNRLCRRIVRSAYPQLELLGQARLMVAVTDDVRRIVAGAEVVPQLLINGVTLLGLLAFLSYIDTRIFVFVLEAVVFGIITFQIPVLIANRYFRIARQLHDSVEKGVRNLILGVKELQIDRQKREGYFSQVLEPCDRKLLAAEKRAMTTLFMANSYGDLLFFFAIGTVAFVFVNYHEISSGDLVAVVMVLLYITAPITVILNMLPRMSMASVSLKKIEEVLGELPEEDEFEQPLCERHWQAISFDDASYRHRNDKAHDAFVVGPLSFSIRKGEITFIVGGNGSGKSTLCKMLSLHYPSTSGCITFGEHAVDTSSIDDLRQGIATIFSDFHLFDRLLCPVDEEKLVSINHYLREFELDSKVQVLDGVFSTTDLSDGQRKRLALVVSFVDNKQLYLLDEWAADQDPVFKKVFYTEILQDLKAQGKAVVVVSHDDRYFHVADQLLIMEDGKLVEKRRKPATTTATANV
ncbi:cyclic peptide export ABC transporter [Dyella humi]|uniref:Cyclic peptide export ABC transporter n=1 Tax=Dyella humi TaxID=1770547 RepID=A0ABW8IDA2_9GAMM